MTYAEAMEAIDNINQVVATGVVTGWDIKAPDNWRSLNVLLADLRHHVALAYGKGRV